MKLQTLSIISGKGGSGKTVISLAMSRVLAEAGYKVLLVDCDIATHGATYFFEGEFKGNIRNILSLSALMRGDASERSLFKTRVGFFFVPSTVNPRNVLNFHHNRRGSDQMKAIITALESLTELCKEREIDVMIFDCQAGYSQIVKEVASSSQRHLVVLEPDAVSSAALRVLHLQLGDVLESHNTWQILNKLTEEERPAYQKVRGGTLFPGLPPVPFDWEIRAAFSISEIPTVTSEWSAFGLGILRTMRTLFPEFSDILAKLENETVGQWYNFLSDRVKELQEHREKVVHRRHQTERTRRIRRIRSIVIPLVALSAFVTAVGIVSGLLEQPITDIIPSSSSGFILGIVGLILLAFTFYWYESSLRDLRIEQTQDIEQETLTTIETELSRYVTLIASDPRLREYERTNLTD